MASEPAEHETCSQEAAAVKAAIRRSIRETRASLGTAVDIRLWTKKSPWIALGLAASAGVGAALFVRRAGHSASTNGKGSPDVAIPAAATNPPEPARGGIGATLASSLFDLAKFGLETAIAAGIREASARSASARSASAGSASAGSAPPPSYERSETATNGSK